MIEIDGSHGEGGGQIIRTSLTLAAITKKEVKIVNIRAKRSNPGLQPQHLMACKAVRNVCRGTLEGAEIGSKELVFHPGEIIGGKYEFDIGTAGSVTLVAQTLIPILLNAKKESTVRIRGGTHVLKSPGYDYFENVFVPAIKEMGAQVKTKITRSGYYPKGGGEIELEIKPSKILGVASWPSDERVKVIIRLGNLPIRIAMREKKIFMEKDIEGIRIMEENTYSPGNAVTAWQGLRGAYVPGEIGKPAETVAKEVLDALEKEGGSDVDLHLADQLLIYAALAEGKTVYKTSSISEHFKTNAEIIGKFLDRRIETEVDFVYVY
jgi:RNA 3'-terminal phosphate cyclase (ATP)